MVWGGARNAEPPALPKLSSDHARALCAAEYGRQGTGSASLSTMQSHIGHQEAFVFLFFFFFFFFLLAPF